MILKQFDYFLKKRDKLLKNNEYLTIVIYFIVLFVIEYSNIMNLYGQNIIRRLINMLRRVDPLNYESKLQPFCVKYEKLLDEDDVKRLQSIKIPDTRDFYIISRIDTTTHQCCDNYSPEEKQIILDISEKLRIKYEKKIGKKLYNMKVNNATIYKYHGNKSQHAWHVDPRNLPEIYNIIVCIKKVGRISPLQCKDESGEEYSIHFDEGDGALFNGGTTVHQVPPNKDPDSERIVLSVTYTSDKKISEEESKNLCTFLEGGNNYKSILIIWFTIFILNFVLTYISGINNLSYPFVTGFLILVFTIARFVPYILVNLGSGRAYSFYYSFLIFLLFVLASFSYKGAIMFFSYFVLSDVFFPKSWVEYD